MKNYKEFPEFHYELPPELIAQMPAEPRDSSRLFVYDTQENRITFDIFSSLSKYLPLKSLLIFNDTKVVPARMNLFKKSGGRVEALFLLNEYQKGDRSLKTLLDRKVDVGAELLLDGGHIFTVLKQEGKLFFLEPQFLFEELPSLLQKYGRTPIPKYIDGGRFSEKELREKYQSVFAREGQSVAAPTASLHFTNCLLRGLRHEGFEEVSVTLHVGQGTFAPVTNENMKTGRLHQEPFFVPQETVRAIRRAKQEGRTVAAVGTTALRALESVAQEILTGNAHPLSGKTELFIRHPYVFAIADALVTNFHLPESSLMFLVDAFLRARGSQKTILELYEEAKREKFRFFSFGDAMLLL